VLLDPEMPVVEWGKLVVPTETLQEPIFPQTFRGRGSVSSGVRRKCGIELLWVHIHVGHGGVWCVLAEGIGDVEVKVRVVVRCGTLSRKRLAGTLMSSGWRACRWVGSGPGATSRSSVMSAMLDEVKVGSDVCEMVQVVVDGEDVVVAVV